MKIRRIDSLSFRLTFWFVLVMAVLIVSAGWFMFKGFNKSLMEETDRSLRTMASDLIVLWERSHGVTWQQAVEEVEKKYAELQPHIAVIKLMFRDDRQRGPKVIAKNERGGFFLMDMNWYRKMAWPRSDPTIFLDISPPGNREYALRTIFRDGPDWVIVQMGVSLQRFAGQLRRLTIVMILAGLLLLFFTSLGGYAIVRRALLPVRHVVQTAQRISTDDLSMRIDSGRRKDEIGELVETFNEMISRLDKSVERIKQFSGDVSHELRTPLTVIRGEIEVLLRRDRKKTEIFSTLASVLEETIQMEHIIEDLLLLSRLDVRKIGGGKEKCDLADLVQRACESRRNAVREKAIALNVRKGGGILVQGDRMLLERMFLNILDNAIRYTPGGGGIDVAIEENRQWVSLSITDTGIGIPEEAIPRIFERFFVVDPSRSRESGGVGLGLAIVKSIVDLHGAAIDVQSRVNGGTRFSVKIPAVKA